MEEKKIIIFTDGSSSGNPGPGGWAAIISASGHVTELGGEEKLTTNNRMELKGVIEALRFLNTTAGDVTVYTDSSYVLQGITKWVKDWQARNWRTATKKAVLNQDLWQELVDVVKKREEQGFILWKLVPGHSGVPGNERVDVIATAYTQKTPVELYDGSLSPYTIDLTSIIPTKIKKKSKSDARSKSGAKAYSYISMVKGEIATHPTWLECEARVKGVKNTKFKKSFSKEEEKTIIEEFKKL